MQLTFINGSPRPAKSNTGRLMEHFIRGFLETAGNKCETEVLARHRKNLPSLAEKFASSEYVIIGFPLYVDAMPGSVKEFIEALEPLAGKKIFPRWGLLSSAVFRKPRICALWPDIAKNLPAVSAADLWAVS